MSDWRVSASPYLVSAERQDGSECIEVYADRDGLDVHYEIGTGHMRESAKFHVPMSTLVALLAGVGFAVVESPNARKPEEKT